MSRDKMTMDYDKTPCRCLECGEIMEADARQVRCAAGIIHPNSQTDLLCPCCGGDADVIDN
jgi:Zn finger protein HypA/HybF involved in hydrogenase expression